jgi:glucan phosphoethanolaminetransferase (alkaline phosphatase superfamily)
MRIVDFWKLVGRFLVNFVVCEGIFFLIFVGLGMFHSIRPRDEHEMAGLLLSLHFALPVFFVVYFLYIGVESWRRRTTKCYYWFLPGSLIGVCSSVLVFYWTLLYY